MKRIGLVILLFFSLSLLFCGCEKMQLPNLFKFKTKAPAEEKTKPVVTPVEPISGTVLVSVNGRVITLEDFNERIENYNKEIQAAQDIPEEVKANYLIKSAEDKKKLLDGMVERELVIAEAMARGLDKDNELVKAVKALKEQLLFAKIIELEKAKISTSDQEVEDYYNMYKGEFTIPEERRVSMIVVPTEGKAKEILISLLQEADFAALARVSSTDKSAANGGDIGFIVRSLPYLPADKKTMFAKFEEVAFNLEVNKPSAIFKGPEGSFYLIKVSEIKPASQREFSEVANNIRQGLMLKKQDEALKALVQGLRRNANIILHDNLLKD